jgi:hypothetical protein
VPLQEVFRAHMAPSLFGNAILNSGNSRKFLLAQAVRQSAAHVLRMSGTQGHLHTRPLLFSLVQEGQLTASVICSTPQK